MADETTPTENNIPQAQQIPVAPKPVVEQFSLNEEKTPLEPTTPVAEEKPVAPVATAKPAMKLDLPKAKYTVTNKSNRVTPASPSVKKVVEVKKDDNPSIMSVAVDFVAAAVAVAFAVMIVLDI